MTRLKYIWIAILVLPFFTSGCKDQEVRDYIKDEPNGFEYWNRTVVHPALEAFCDLERLIYQGIPQPDGTYVPFVEHAPIPPSPEVMRWCSEPGSSVQPPPLHPEWDRIDLSQQLPDALAPSRLRLAEIYLARGEFARAHDVAAVFDHPEPMVFIPFVPRSLQIRLEAAGAMGHVGLVEEYTRRLRELGRGNLVPASSQP